MGELAQKVPDYNYKFHQDKGGRPKQVIRGYLFPESKGGLD